MQRNCWITVGILSVGLHYKLAFLSKARWKSSFHHFLIALGSTLLHVMKGTVFQVILIWSLALQRYHFVIYEMNLCDLLQKSKYVLYQYKVAHSFPGYLLFMNWNVGEHRQRLHVQFYLHFVVFLLPNVSFISRWISQLLHLKQMITIVGIEFSAVSVTSVWLIVNGWAGLCLFMWNDMCNLGHQPPQVVHPNQCSHLHAQVLRFCLYSSQLHLYYSGVVFGVSVTAVSAALTEWHRR